MANAGPVGSMRTHARTHALMLSFSLSLSIGSEILPNVIQCVQAGNRHGIPTWIMPSPQTQLLVYLETAHWLGKEGFAELLVPVMPLGSKVPLLQ